MLTQRILIVDDDRNIQTMLRICLRDQGYQVELAPDGREALEAIRRDRPDLVLLDLAMPVLDGMSVLAELHSMPRGAAPRVIVMTAHGSVRTAIQAVRLGASDFLEKPFAPEDVRLSIASVLDDTGSWGDEPITSYDNVLHLVRGSLRAGKFSQAEALLMKAGTIADTDPAFLNLAGVLHESHGRRTSARRFYEKSLASDDHYEPARQNLRRLFEIDRYGESRDEVAFGDEQAMLEGFRGRVGLAQLEQIRRLVK
jgi:DNA-binding response OmpR family regulator